MAFRARHGHPRDIEPIAPTFATRHASTIAVVIGVLALSGAVGVIWVDRTGAIVGRLLSDPMTTASELVCFGVVGAVLIARRPDLPFGWILALGALGDVVLVGIGLPSLALVDHQHGGQLPVWGVSLGVLQWLGVALEGIINVRFPSGRPSGGFGQWLDRLLCYGIPLGLVGNYLGDSVTSDLGDTGPPLHVHRVIDDTWLTPLGNASVVLIPALILGGILAGVGVVVRWVRASGIERKQLHWRAAGVASSLLLFPLAVSGSLGGAFGAIEPLVLVSTLVIPVLRYQLWQGDPLPRRHRLGLLVSRRTLVEARERRSGAVCVGTCTTASGRFSPACGSTSMPLRPSWFRIRRRRSSTLPRPARSRRKPSPTCAASSTASDRRPSTNSDWRVRSASTSRPWSAMRGST